MNTQNIEATIISKPQIKFEELKETNGITKKKFAGLKVSVISKRKKLISILNGLEENQTHFAKDFGVTQAQFSQFLNEKNVNSIPASLKILFKMNEILNVVGSKKIEFAVPERVNKQNARNIMDKHINLSNLLDGNILTLSSKNPILEKQIVKNGKNNFHFISYENDIDTFKELQQNLAKESNLLMSANFGSISNYIETAKPNSLSHATVDYCSQFSTIKNDIKTIIENDIVKVGGTISLTVSKARDKNVCENYKNMFSETELNKIANNQNQPLTELGITFELCTLLNGKYIIAETFPYFDTSAMFLVVIKRVS